MNFEHLKYITIVAKNRNISTAARELYVSQPYLSRMITKIEKELGYSIFARTSRALLPTEEGKLFLDSAEFVLKELDKMYSFADKNRHTAMKIAAYYSSVFMKLYLRFQEEISACPSDSYEEMGIEEVIHSVSEERNSLGIICYAPSRNDKYAEIAAALRCRIEQVGAPFPLYVFVSECHELARKESVCIEDLKRYRYVCYRDASSLRYLSILGIDSKKDTLLVSNRGSMTDAILFGGYLTVASILDVGDYPGTALIPLSNRQFYLNMGAVFRENYLPRERERRFLKYMKEQTAEMMGIACE